MLILNNDEIDSLLSVDLALRALEKAYREQANGRAINRPRTDLYLPGKEEGTVYSFKSMEGGLEEAGIVALRLNSDVIHWEAREGRVIKEKIPSAPGKKWVGLILLFSAETGEPLAIFPDGVIQRMRVAATSALAGREMARPDASVLSIFGSGWQAGGHVEAFCKVRRIEKIRSYSPTKAKREHFAREIESRVRIPVQPMNRPEDIAVGADILIAATNAITTVIQPDWVEPGMHVTCVKDCELGEATIRKATRIAIHSRKFAPENYIVGLGDEKIEVHDPIDHLRQKSRPARAPAPPFWIGAPEIKDIIAGRFKGRESPDEITCFINNIGLGIQFAAVGSAIYSEAKTHGVGREIPTDWFLESVHP
jgi:ornithine cyclodeaminase/alanine dehydrogenase-like protein (mu-crystallin family)